MPIFFGNAPKNVIEELKHGSETASSLCAVITGISKKIPLAGYEFHMKRSSRFEYLLTHPPAKLVKFCKECAKKHNIDLPPQRYFLTVVPPKKGHQSWHYDSDTSDFFTLLIQVIAPENCGCTQFEETTDVARYETEYVMFDGQVVHRGGKNNSNDYRVFLYVTFHDSAFKDLNVRV